MATHSYKVTTSKRETNGVEADEVTVCPDGAYLRNGGELVMFVPMGQLISVQRTTATPAGDG